MIRRLKRFFKAGRTRIIVFKIIKINNLTGKLSKIYYVEEYIFEKIKRKKWGSGRPQRDSLKI